MAVAGRSISMFSLITDGILEPGDRLLTFDYLVRLLTQTQWDFNIYM